MSRVKDAASEKQRDDDEFSDTDEASGDGVTLTKSLEEPTVVYTEK